MYLYQQSTTIVKRRTIGSLLFPPSILCVPPPQGVSPFLSLRVTSVRQRGHADASYRAAVCILCDVLLLTALFSSNLSFHHELTGATLTRYKPHYPCNCYLPGIMPALLQEVVSVYLMLSAPKLTACVSNRICNALALLQCRISS
jgi:hypothetical protein